MKSEKAAVLESLKATFQGIEKQLASQNELLNGVVSLLQKFHNRLAAIEAILTVARTELIKNDQTRRSLNLED